MVSQLAAPLYDQGARLPRVRARYTHSVRQPSYPLYEGWGFHGLGQQAAEGPTIVKASAPVAATATTAILASTEAGTAIGAWAGPIGAGVGVLVGIIAGLWAAHSARVAGATHENQGINSAVSTWDAAMKAIFSAANSSDPSTNVPGPTAAQQVQQVYQQFWAMQAPLMRAPGVSDASGGGLNCGSSSLNPAGPCAGTPGGHKCDASCTATCCVGCQDLFPSMLQAVQVLNSPTGGTVQVCSIARSSYGASGRPGYTLTYNPPAVSPLATASSDLSSLFGGSATGGGSILPILALGLIGYFLVA